jgi:hypothetical protein
MGTKVLEVGHAHKINKWGKHISDSEAITEIIAMTMEGITGHPICKEPEMRTGGNMEVWTQMPRVRSMKRVQ